MKKLFATIAIIFLVNVSFATVTPTKPPLNAADIMFPVGNTGQKISLLQLSTIRMKEFELLRGEKMKFIDRLTFKAAQKKVRESINNDGTISNKKLTKAFKNQKGGETGFHVGGFALGFLLGLIGIIIAYIIKDDYKKNRVKWAWIGFGVYLAIFLAIVAAGGFDFYY